MSKRRNLSTICLVMGLFLLAGCQTTTPENEPAESSETAAPVEDARARREGGNVRSTPFLPAMPSEIERADLRTW